MKTILVALLGMISVSAMALPVAPFDALKSTIGAPKSQNNDSQYDFEGIVKLSNCSGSLIIFPGMPLTAKAIVMTNGHCIQKPGGYLGAGEVWLNKTISRSMKLYDSQFKLHSITATKILFATMTNTDLAFYELSENFHEIKARTDVEPFMFDTQRPKINDSIEIISGYWDRGWSCEIDGFVFKMKEGIWTWNDSIRYTSTCDTMGGTSGSPIIAKGERRVVGVNNTSNENGGMCTVNNPCEVDENGQSQSYPGVRYGQQTYNVVTCLTPDFNFDLNLKGCSLPKLQE